jgi:hypothetical protein
MLKHLPVFIVLILFFSAARAQTHADSTKNLPADSIKKIVVIDTISKKAAIDTIVKKDSANVRLKTDTAIKSAIVVKSSADSSMIDSVAKRSAIVKSIIDSAAKRPKIDSSAKHSTDKKLVKRSAAPALVVKHSPIKTLSDERYNAYLKGDDLDSMALVGEMNHYPLPDYALKYKVQIGLNPGQITKLKALATVLQRKKVEMGENIIRNEKMLDSLFHSKQVIDGTLIFYTNRSGLYLGELRGAILMACYETEKILSDDQIRKLEALEKGN